MLIPDPRRTPLPNLISHNGIILYQWEFIRARLDEGEGMPWIAMDPQVRVAAVSLGGDDRRAAGKNQKMPRPAVASGDTQAIAAVMRARAEAPRSRAADTPTRVVELPALRPCRARLIARPEPGVLRVARLLPLPGPARFRLGSYMAYDDAVLLLWLPAALLCFAGRCLSEGKKLSLKFAAEACLRRMLGGTGLEQLLRLALP